MTICLSRDACLKNKISIGEALLLYAISLQVDFSTAEKLLIKKGYITATRNDLFQQDGWRVTRKGNEIIDFLVADSEKTKDITEENLENLAKSLKEIFPKGKKEGTNYYWADGVSIIIKRLKLFFKKYGTKYSNDQIINAAKKYVEGFNGNYTYMKLLKYFIFKDKVGATGEIEGESELISYIENDGQEDTLSSDWNAEIR